MVTALLALAHDMEENDELLVNLTLNIFKVTLFELKNVYWGGSFLSPKVDQDSQEDLNSLFWLLKGYVLYFILKISPLIRENHYFKI